MTNAGDSAELSDRPPVPGGTGERPQGSEPGGTVADGTSPDEAAAPRFADGDAPFAAFAAALADIAALSGRLDKADRLGALFARLGDADLARAARWTTGRVFPLADERTVEIGYRRIADALEAVTDHDADALAEALVRLGDPGEVAAWALGETEGHPDDGTAMNDGGGLTLAEAEAFFETVAETRGSAARTEIVAGMLARLRGDAARYLAKTLSGDGLRIGLSEGGVEKALERLYERDGAAIRRAAMLTGDYGETAVLARHDRLADARLHLFHPVRFMLATAAEASDERTLADDVARQIAPPFAVEDKFDGIRAQAHIEMETDAPEGATPREDLHGEVVETADGARVRVALFSRTLDSVERAFPDLWLPLAALAEHPGAAGGVILDGEIVPLGADGGIAGFQTLQKRLGRKRVPQTLLDEAPVGFVAYDVLAWDGAPTLDDPFSARGAHLDTLDLPSADGTGGRVRRSRVQTVDDAETLDALFDAARARGNEGLMVKALGATYRPGKRGRDWLKVKKALATLDVVVTAAQVGSGGRRKLLSDLTFAVRGPDPETGAPTLLNVGKAYSGLTDAELTELTAWFKAHTIETFAHGRVRTVEPEVVLEVAFDAVQASPRHKGGYALRFPRIVRRRPDKPVAEIDTIDTVAALAGDA